MSPPVPASVRMQGCAPGPRHRGTCCSLSWVHPREEGRGLPPEKTGPEQEPGHSASAGPKGLGEAAQSPPDKLDVQTCVCEVPWAQWSLAHQHMATFISGTLLSFPLHPDPNQGSQTYPPSVSSTLAAEGMVWAGSPLCPEVSAATQGGSSLPGWGRVPCTMRRQERGSTTSGHEGQRMGTRGEDTQAVWCWWGHALGPPALGGPPWLVGMA